MGLFQNLFKGNANVSFEAPPMTILTPLDGCAMNLGKLPDEVFASGTLGNVRSQGRGSVLFPLPAQAVRIPEACCTATSPIRPAVPGSYRIRPQWRCSRWKEWFHPRTGLLPG